jgi:hypothetical protein
MKQRPMWSDRVVAEPARGRSESLPRGPAHIHEPAATAARDDQRPIMSGLARASRFVMLTMSVATIVVGAVAFLAILVALVLSLPIPGRA